MPTENLRANLNTAIFPFYTEAAGRTIIVPGDDETYDRYNAANTTPEKGVAQVYYMQDVMPIASGYQSVGYIPEIGAVGLSSAFLAGTQGMSTAFDQIFTLITPDSSNTLFSPAGGLNYIYDNNLGQWTSINPLYIKTASNTESQSLIPANTVVTTAYINNQTYFCYSKYGVFTYDNIQKQIIQQNLISLNTYSVKGITAAVGYLITWSDTAIAWSSLINPLDFTPSIDTGAGGGSVQFAKGKINFCLPISGGFLIYCEKNTVAATYTNNTSYPFLLKEVEDSGGCNDPNQIAWQTNLDTHYALTTNGLQGVTLTSANNVMPEFTDFLAAQIFEDFNFTTNLPEIQYLNAQVNVRLAAVQARFICISYGISSSLYTHCVIYDLTLGRWGKLAHNHIQVFQNFLTNIITGQNYNQLLSAGTTYQQLKNSNLTYEEMFLLYLAQSTQKQNLCLLQVDGTVLLLDFGLQQNYTVLDETIPQTGPGPGSNVGTNAVLILGKYQYVRNAYITHQTTEIESSVSGSNFQVLVSPTLDGKTLLPPISTIMIGSQAGLTAKYAARVTGSNISFIIMGTFHLTSTVMEFTRGGFR